MPEVSATYSCPVATCNKTRTTRAQVTFHLRKAHQIELPFVRGARSREVHAKVYAKWCEDKGYPIDLTFFISEDVTTKPVMEEHSDDDEPVFLGTRDADTAWTRGENGGNYWHSKAYFQLLRQRMKLFHDEHGNPKRFEFDVEHVALLFCSVDDPAIETFESWLDTPCGEGLTGSELAEAVKQTAWEWDIGGGWKEREHFIYVLMPKLKMARYRKQQADRTDAGSC
jgi:hypothetical protein